MRQIILEEVIERLDDLVEEAAAGQPFVIVKDGKPLARVEPCAPPAHGKGEVLQVGAVDEETLAAIEAAECGADLK